MPEAPLWTAEDAAAATGGKNTVPWAALGVSIDSRTAAPDALRAALEALRPHALARLVVVFGCGGERDRGKRPEMGRIAEAVADQVIVTDDNPRGEDAAAIRREILDGCRRAREIGDRAEAIRAAAAGLAPRDLLLIAGKGHETGQIVGGRRRPFDDVEVARLAVATDGAMDA